ncbi:YlbL family protein [Demequina sp.]|uniref:YlbL family protein n=1 Tax=Demequina sp. TaxID=2050685 RepID=UPI003D0CFB02
MLFVRYEHGRESAMIVHVNPDTDVDTLAPEPLEFADEQAARRATVLSVTGLAVSILIAALTIIPAAFAIGSAGPTFDTLGEKDGEPLVTIEGAPTYESTGELRLTTVSVADAGGTPFTMGRVLSAWVSQREYTLPREWVFGSPKDEDAVAEQSRTDWISSQESATVAALEELGHPVPATITVAEVPEDSGAAGHLQEDDVIVAVDGTTITTYDDLADVMESKTPGDAITVTVKRGGVQLDQTFDTSDDGNGNAIMGIYVDPTFDLPIDVTVAIDSVGGPSAGLMFSLGIMDKLTPEDELAGAKVAGTGTIAASGDVGPIGGIRMKMWGAHDAGSAYFLAPVENCDEVVGNIPPGLSVFSVNTLDDAYTAIVAIGKGDTASLPTC